MIVCKKNWKNTTEKNNNNPAAHQLQLPKPVTQLQALFNITLSILSIFHSKSIFNLVLNRK
jgi:hypothetical protein